MRPSEQDPRVLSALEAALWERLPIEFVGLDLSPVTPFGTCAALGGVDQNRVLTTTRTSEVVSDHTAVLALEAAQRRRQKRDGVHLAAMHRVLRTQRFPEGFSQHFRLLALVSSSRDAGSGRTEAELLIQHLRFYVSTLSDLFPADLVRVSLTSFADGPVSERLRDAVLPMLDPLPRNVEIVDDPGRTRARGYYRDVAMRIDLVRDGNDLEIGDGGFTDWTASLLGDSKERCLTTCIATERLASVWARQT